MVCFVILMINRLFFFRQEERLNISSVEERGLDVGSCPSSAVVLMRRRCLCVCRYGLMLECWQQNPFLRPSFADLVPSLDNMLELTVNEVFKI